jgi:hypothetical protein
MDFDDIVEQNPWWRRPENVQLDPKIREFQDAKIKWYPRLMHTIDLEKDILYSLRGPRQVGKTTMLKLMIKDLLNRGIDAKAILYLTCDVISGHDALVEAVTQYLDYSKRLGPEVRKYLFIDEITSVKDWPKAIKYLKDIGRLSNTTIILTGSHSLDLKYQTERLPGRRGEGDGAINKILMPMKFAEYVETVAPELNKEMGLPLEAKVRQEMFFKLCNGEIPPFISETLRLYQKDLNAILDNYLLTGGIMRAIESFFSKDRIDESIYELYIRALIGDLGKWRYGETIAKQVLRSAMQKMCSRVSLNNIASENEIGSHNTVSSYLQAMDESFVLNNIYLVDLNSKEPVFIKERKIYFTDPFIYHAVRGWVFGRPDYHDLSKDVLLDSELKGNIMEMVISDHLIRQAYALDPSDVFSPHEHVMYFRKKDTDREIDFILKHRKSLYPFEVKYRKRIGRKELENLFILRKGVLITKDILSTHNQYSLIPVELFLLLI